MTVTNALVTSLSSCSIFPVNELRNLAIKAVTTTHYLYSDVDFFPSSWMFETISNSSKLLTILAADYRNTVVIPAFERSIHMCGEINEGLSESEKRTFKECVSKLEMPTDLASVRNQYKKRMVRVFDSKWGDAGHGSTGTTSWLGLKPGKVRLDEGRRTAGAKRQQKIYRLLT